MLTRIQLSRAKGWRMPPNTVKVDRSTPWGNPWRSGEVGPGSFVPQNTDSAVALFRRMLRDPDMRKAAQYPDDLTPLRRRNLACWCRPGEPCHADVLLEHLSNPRIDL